MTKLKFDELLATSNKIVSENRKQIGQNVLDTVPLFKAMTTVNKRKLLEAMIPMTYLSSSYICRQGTTGNTFFILTDGTCRVTINQPDHSEKEVARLHAGDFFGEVALIETSNRRTANVISLEAVSCLTLNRSDFNRLLKSLKVKLHEQQVLRSNKNVEVLGSSHADYLTNMKQLNTLSQKRRVSGFNTHGQRDDMRIASLLKRTGAFMNIALWNSLYSRYYRDILLDPNKVVEYGKYAAFILRSNDLRFEAVSAIREQTIRILEMDPGRRTASEHAFILGLLKQRNNLKDKLCKTWPMHQFNVLCRKLKLIRAKCFRKIIEVDSKGTTAFLIVRGAVRIYTRVQRDGGGESSSSATEEKSNSRVFYEEDLYPGDTFAEPALSGMHTRFITALAMTDVDLITIDDQDFMMAQDRASVSHMSTEDKSKFLSTVNLFRGWDSYKLFRLAHALVQEEVVREFIFTTKDSVCGNMYFITHGTVDIFDSYSKENKNRHHVITTLSTGDYLGESGFCNRFVKAINSKVTEDFYAVASSNKVEVLVLQEQHFNLFDMGNIDIVRTGFLSKQTWRKERVEAMRWERAKVRKSLKIMEIEAEFLPYLRRKEEQAVAVAVAAAVAASGDASGNGQQQGDVVSKPSPYDFHLNNSNNTTTQQHQQPVIEVARADLAYQAALVHPLDDHLHDAKNWIPPSQNSAHHLKNIEDIPNILNHDFDLLMVASSCRDQRTVDRVHDLVLQARRPTSALLHNNHHGNHSPAQHSGGHHSAGQHGGQQGKKMPLRARPASAFAVESPSYHKPFLSPINNEDNDNKDNNDNHIHRSKSFSTAPTSSVDTRFYNAYGIGGQNKKLTKKEAKNLEQQKRDARFSEKRPLAMIPKLTQRAATTGRLGIGNNNDNSFVSSVESIPPMIIQTIVDPNAEQQQLRPVSAPSNYHRNQQQQQQAQLFILPAGLHPSFLGSSSAMDQQRMTVRGDVPYQQDQPVGMIRRNLAFPAINNTNNTQQQRQQQLKQTSEMLTSTMMVQSLSPGNNGNNGHHYHQVPVLTKGNSSMLLRLDPDDTTHPLSEQQQAAQQHDVPQVQQLESREIEPMEPWEQSSQFLLQSPQQQQQLQRPRTSGGMTATNRRKEKNKMLPGQRMMNAAGGNISGPGNLLHSRQRR